MEVKKYTPLWQLENNACDKCAVELIDVNYSILNFEEDNFLYIIVNGVKYICLQQSIEGREFDFLFSTTDGQLNALDEELNPVLIDIPECSVYYSYAFPNGDSGYIYEGIAGTIKFIDFQNLKCHENILKLTYNIDCVDEYIYFVNAALNRLPQDGTDQTFGILPSGQSKKIFQRIQNKTEFRTYGLNESQLEKIEFIMTLPSMLINDVEYFTSDGSVFTFDNQSNGIFFGVCELIKSTNIVSLCCSGS